MTDQSRLEPTNRDPSLDSAEPRRDYVDQLLAVATRFGKALLLLLVVYSATALVYYLFKGYIVEFHSDSAVKNLLAEEVIREGTYFPRDWNYVNGDLWVLFGQTFIIPFLPFLPNGFALHSVSGLISSIILLLSLWWTSAMVISSRWMRLFVVTIVAGGVSVLLAEHLFGQVSYGNVLFLCALTLYSGWRLLEAAGHRSVVSWGVAFAIVTLLTFWGNPQRAAAYDLLPMTAGVVAWLWGRADLLQWRVGSRSWALSPELRRAIAVMILMVVAAGAGTLLHAHAVDQVNNAAGAGSARWLSFDGFLANLKFTLYGILATFSAIPAEGAPVMSLGGIYEAGRFVAVMVLLALIPLSGMRFVRAAAPSARLFAGFALSGLMLFVFLQTTTTTPDMSSPTISARYMVPSLVLGLVMVAGYAEVQGVRRMGGALAWVVLLILATSFIYPGNSFSRLYRGQAESINQIQARELASHGLKYGYASFWNSNSVTVLSEGEVKVRPILLQNGVPLPHRHLASNAWFRPSAWSGRTFLMLSKQERDSLDRDVLKSLVGDPVETFLIGDFEVLVYPMNLASRLPGWDVVRTRDTSLSVPLTVLSRHQVGEFDGVGGVGGAGVLRAPSGPAGFLHFGPYLALPAGRYELQLMIDVAGEGEAGYVDVVSAEGRNLLASTPISGSISMVSLPIDTKKDQEMVEIRVYTNGKAPMALRSISLTPEGGQEAVKALSAPQSIHSEAKASSRTTPDALPVR